MRLDECIKRIDRYLNSDDYTPRLVNFLNISDLAEFMEKFSVGNNDILSVASYTAKDENPKLDDFWSILSRASRNVFVTEMSTQLKLQGERVLTRELINFADQTFDVHVVVICYQCEQFLQFTDSRANRLVYFVDGNQSCLPEIILTLPQLPQIPGTIVVDGIENIAATVEKMDGGKFYVKSSKHKSSYPFSLLYIVEESKAFDALCNVDRATEGLDIGYGTEEQWAYALSEVTKVGLWGELIDHQFSVSTNLSLIASSWKSFSKNKRWLYFIGLKLYGAGDNWCLNEAIKKSDTIEMFLRNIYRSILSIEPETLTFWEKYDERKSIITSFGISEGEVIDYLQMLKSKKEKALYYLTDGSRREKEYIFELLAQYADKFSRDEIYRALFHIYPDLYDYLQPYRFKNETMFKYFEDYKFQKVVNKIFPEFRKIVEEQAIERNFISWLPPRSEKVESLNKTNARLYFVDAMGVEYLSFILARCKDMDLMANIQICCCELPSITKLNKEFLEQFTDIAPDVKRLDDIKHYGEESFDYRHTKLPVHLIRELEIIREVLSDIRDRLASGSIDRAYIIADHGASRLAVINEHENQWEMASKGEHSGRCCPKNEADVQSEYALDINDFWVLANYDRFRGGRKASVEVHGGATLEEVTVPIIEFTYVTEKIEVSINSKLPIKISFRKKAELQLFSKTKLGGVTVCVSGKKLENFYYDAEFQGNNLYLVRMPDIKNAGDYNMVVYSNNIEVANLQFSVKKEGSSERSLL